MSIGLELTKSKLKRALLTLYFSDPDREYYVRELERVLGFSAANIYRDLVAFSISGLFISRKQGNLVYWGLNKNHPLYEEMKTIVFKTIGIEGSLRDIISKDKGINTAYIYGSFADGQETSDSDVDVLIIGRPDETQLMKEIGALEQKVGREINYTVYSVSDYRKKKEAKDSFIENIEAKARIIFKEKGKT